MSDEPGAPDGAATVIEGSIDFTGRTGDIVGLVIKNALLNIITLGFYRFWGRTNVRRYLWRKTEVFAAPLEYTGTGKELFVGFLLIVVLVFVPYAILNVVLESSGLLADATFAIAYNLLVTLIIFYLIGVASYRARRYRLTRTRWRSIRLGQTGSSWRFGFWYLGLNLLMFFLGLITPYKNMKLWQLKTQNTHVGDRFLEFDREGASGKILLKLYARFMLPCFFAALVIYLPALFFVSEAAAVAIDSTLAIDELSEQIVGHLFALPDNYGTLITVVWPLAFMIFLACLVWYKLEETRLLVSLTGFGPLRPAFEARGGSYFGLWLGNMLIQILTLGFGLPFTQLRYVGWVCKHTQIDGQLDLSDISQSLDDDLTSGEGLAEAFDMGAV